MDGKVDLSVAETVASDSLMGNGPQGRGEDISRVTSTSHEDEGRFVPGTLLGGRYRIIGLLGRGGMGEVYRATDLTLGHPVALKFLPEEAARNQRLLERFHGEVRVARLVSHPNVCRVYDIGEVEGMPFISMEYVDGEDLGSLLRRIGRLPADKALEIARKLCAGLAAAHDKGVLHRDLKPANIMLDGRGQVLITDFGLAALSGQIQAHEIRHGTPAYMAPEQLAGKEVTPASDIYSLGLVLYEIFAGKRAFEADTLDGLLKQEESSAPTSLVTLVKEIDPAIERVILRCLAPEPRQRPASALAVAAAEELATEGSQIEVVDLRSVKPLDTDTVMASVARTGRLLCVGESWPWGGVTAEVIARVVTEGFGLLDAPPQRLNAKDTPVPYHPSLWAAHRPTAQSIAAANSGKTTGTE